MKSRFLGVVAIVGVVSLLLTAPAVAAATWPSNKGERCWLDNEGNTVVAFITKMRAEHYLLHGRVIHAPPKGPQVLNGNAELLGGLVTGSITGFQINDPGTAFEVVEGFAGIFWIDTTTLNGTAEGISYLCPRFGPFPRTDCEVVNNGPVTLTPITCP